MREAIRNCVICGVNWLPPRGMQTAHAESGMCSTCWVERRVNPSTRDSPVTCGRCGHAYRTFQCGRCRVADRVGADFFECPCGARVPTASSQRVARGNSIIRMCIQCVNEGGCSNGHSIVTSSHRDWSEAKFGYGPVPDDFKRGVCAKCDISFFWDASRWTRMTWLAVAEAWEKVDV